MRGHFMAPNKAARGAHGGPAPIKSPLAHSPLVRDPVSLEALDLNPGPAPTYDPQTIRDFHRFKNEQRDSDASKCAPWPPSPPCAQHPLMSLRMTCTFAGKTQTSRCAIALT